MTETKQTAVDFSKWIETNEWYHNYKWQRTLSKEELYDIFASERQRSVATTNTKIVTPPMNTDKQRVIKFRAWNKDKKQFIYSDWKYGELSFWETILNDYTNEFEPKQQSIGLDDWSEPAQEIFEGDIVLCDGKQRTIKWSNGKFWFVAESCNYHEDISEMFGKYYGKVKVIGNIYSPEK